MALKLYCNVTGTTGIKSCAVSTSHGNATSVAIVEAISTTLSLGDSITVDMGYVGNHALQFTGYVKQVEKKVPEKLYSITAGDVMVRAQDTFIAASNPLEPLKYNNIAAELLIKDLIERAGITSFDYDETSFVFGPTSEFEINLVNTYDYCKMISDALTWSLWADLNGTVQFKNRKPYVMLGSDTPESLQVGWVSDPAPTYTLYDTVIQDLSFHRDIRNLRNRVVVYGNEGVFAEATRTSQSLPVDVVKSAVLAFAGLVDNNTLAQQIADYNVSLYNRAEETVVVSIIGDPSLQARTVIALDENRFDITGTWYVFSCEHNLSSSGYITTLTLKNLLKDDIV